MRKLLSLVLVLSLVLGSMSFAFAGEKFSDVTDEDVLEAVKRLNAFGIVDGYDDGTYKPENDITRAEFAKLLVEALGLGSAAGATGASQFSDVPANAWYAGYVAVAAGQGIVKGNPDGTFAPNKNVTYAEAVTMLVRALGYKDSFLAGSWPGNFVAKAAELDITDDVKFTAGGFANRGAVAIMLDNTLDAKMVQQKTYGDDNNWEESDETLLESKLNIVKIKDVRFEVVPKADEDLKDNEVTLDVSIGGDKTFEIVQEGTVANDLFGLQADIYLNDDDEIVYVDLDDEEVVNDEIKENLTKDSTEVSLVIKDDEFELNEDVTVYINNEKKAVKDVKDDMFGRIVFNDDDEVIFMDLYDFDAKAMLVKEVDTDKEKVVVYVNGSDSEKTYDLTDPDAYKFVLDGQEIALDEVEVDDVLYLAEVDERGDEVWRFIVVRDAVEGELEKVNNDEELVVDGDEYALVASSSTFSLDDDDEITAYQSESDVADIEDAVGENVKVILNIVGDVRHMRSDVDATSASQYGVLHKQWTSSEDMVRIYTSNDEEVSYEYDDEKVYLNSTSNAIALDSNFDSNYKYRLAEFAVDKDGIVDELIVYTTSGRLGDSTSTAKDAIDDDDETIMINGQKYFVTDDTVMYEVDDDASANREDAEVVTWDDIKDAKVDYTANVTVEYVLDGDILEAILFVTNYDAIASEYEVGVVTDRFYDGDWKATVDVFDGEETTYELQDKDDVAVGDVIEFTISGDEINVVTTLVDATDSENFTFAGSYDTDGLVSGTENDAVYSTVYDKDSKVIEVVGGTASYKVTDKTVIYEFVQDEDAKYDELKKADISDIAEDDKVIVAYENGMRDAKAIFVIDDSEVTVPSSGGGSTANGDYKVLNIDTTASLLTLEDADGNVKVFNLPAGNSTVVKETDGTLTTLGASTQLTDQMNDSAADEVNITLTEGTTDVTFITIIVNN